MLQEDLHPVEFPQERVEFSALIPWKKRVLDAAFHRFRLEGPKGLGEEFAAFKTGQSSWLEDFSLFMALKDAHKEQRWDKWPGSHRRREAASLAVSKKEFAEGMERHAFRQFLFFLQWKSLKEYAASKGVRIIGDVPIFVSSDSADVWAHPDLFQLDEALQPTVVAGVPPDYFSPTGQLCRQGAFSSNEAGDSSSGRDLGWQWDEDIPASAGRAWVGLMYAG